MSTAAAAAAAATPKRKMSIGSERGTPARVEGEPAAKRRRHIMLSDDSDDSDNGSEGTEVSAMERQPTHLLLDDEAADDSGSGSSSSSDDDGEGEGEGEDDDDEGGSSRDSLSEQRANMHASALAHIDTVMERVFKHASHALAAEMALDLVMRAKRLAEDASVPGDTRDGSAVGRRVGRERARSAHARALADKK
jgi:hypothetical protein